MSETGWYSGPRMTPGQTDSPLSLVVDDAPWMVDGLCAQTDPEAFFPEKGGSTKAAKRVCLSCSVREECLDYAVQHQVRYGIWGGLSERQRRHLKPMRAER